MVYNNEKQTKDLNIIISLIGIYLYLGGIFIWQKQFKLQKKKLWFIHQH